MRITEQEFDNIEKSFRKIGLFYCSSCQSYFKLFATKSGLSACPVCGARESDVLSVKVFSHDDNDLDDDYD